MICLTAVTRMSVGRDEWQDVRRSSATGNGQSLKVEGWFMISNLSSRACLSFALLMHNHQYPLTQVLQTYRMEPLPLSVPPRF